METEITLEMIKTNRANSRGCSHVILAKLIMIKQRAANTFIITREQNLCQTI